MPSVQLNRLKQRIPDAQDSDLQSALDDAEDAILARRYPFCECYPPLPERFYGLQLRAAVVIYNKRGAEGESSHNELGVSRSYEPLEELLKEVTPLGVVR